MAPTDDSLVEEISSVDDAGIEEQNDSDDTVVEEQGDSDDAIVEKQDADESGAMEEQGDSDQIAPTQPTLTAQDVAAEPVSYMAWDDTAEELVEHSGDDACRDYAVVSDQAAWEAGWYVVSGDVTISQRITVTGTANLILCDGASLTVSAGISVTTGNTLNIYAQSAGTGKQPLPAKRVPVLRPSVVTTALRAV